MGVDCLFAKVVESWEWYGRFFGVVWCLFRKECSGVDGGSCEEAVVDLVADLGGKCEEGAL